MSGRLSPAQQRALDLIDNNGQASDACLWLEGFNRPRATFRSLERRGLVKCIGYEGEEVGYLYDRVRDCGEENG